MINHCYKCKKIKLKDKMLRSGYYSFICKKCKKIIDKEKYIKYKTKILKCKKEYYQKNRKEKLIKAKEYQRINKIKINNYYKRYYKANKIKISKRRHKWYIENKEKILAIGRRYSKKNKNKINLVSKVYRQNHKVEILWRNKERKNKIRKVIGSHTVKEWKKLKKEYNYMCPCCGKKKKLTEDHIIPIKKNGTDYINNIQPLCQSCNSKKHIKIIFFEPCLVPAKEKRLKRLKKREEKIKGRQNKLNK